MNDISELRATLFETLRALNDKENPMPVERAKAVAEVAQTVINTAKVEVEYMKATKSVGTGFLGPALPPAEPEGDANPDVQTVMTPTGVKTVQRVGETTITRHRLK